MRVRLIFWVLLFGTSCHSGLLPCPHPTAVRMRKNNVNKPLRQFMASMSAKAEADNEMRNIHNKSSRSSSGQFQNVSVEEWDCPRPGSKKYMPKSVKDNIKKNLKKVTTDSRSSADSVQVR